jgi:ketosteroid isomerase-like protein
VTAVQPESANVRLLRHGYDKLNEGGIDAAIHLIHEDALLEEPSDWLDRSVMRGREGVRDWFAAQYEVWDRVEFEPLEYIDAGERVVVVVRLTARGRESGLELDALFMHVWTIRDGLAAELRAFTDKQAALEAAGLRDVA